MGSRCQFVQGYFERISESLKLGSSLSSLNDIFLSTLDAYSSERGGGR